MEPERHNRQQLLEEQRDRTARQRVVETREVKKRLERSCSSFPDFVESDGESDEKDSLCEEPQFESGGDEGASVERDMWADYPAQKLDNEFKSDAQTPAHAAEEAPVDLAPDLGCSVDGKSGRPRGQYLCLMGKKQVPPGVRQALWRVSQAVGKAPTAGRCFDVAV